MTLQFIAVVQRRLVEWIRLVKLIRMVFIGLGYVGWVRMGCLGEYVGWISMSRALWCFPVFWVRLIGMVELFRSGQVDPVGHFGLIGSGWVSQVRLSWLGSRHLTEIQTFCKIKLFVSEKKLFSVARMIWNTKNYRFHNFWTWNLGSHKSLIIKNFGSENILGFKKIWVKKIKSEKYWVPKILDPKRHLVHKKIL